MDFAESADLHALPRPRTAVEVAATFGRPVFTFVDQPRLGLTQPSTIAHDDVLHAVALNYVFVADPSEPDAPSNLVEGVAEIDAHLANALAAGQPDWFVAGLRAFRHPLLWEAVVTTTAPADPEPPAVPVTVADHLARHVNHVLINTAEGRSRRPDGAVPVLDAPVTARHAQPGAVLVVDDVERDAVLIDTDPDVVGWGAEVDGSIVLVVLPRDRVPLVDLRLTSLAT
ncbi:hypothetical protein [Frigoribacterium sp. Leaf186]|uniref:hypothetical protein n=1 Tax=Frigoribacterium sp. Leaf186 TaxID=1736293 RepID=UPI0006F4A8F1|nr:hypothetical protein [Frigoribacterium sp. Leaf186]KQS22900.1 hypothetical protein ASG05_05345 [Frigoribacterium sp. Leaf186]